jgi:hypothetical protein
MTSETAQCDRCGQVAEGRRRWMFYRPLERFPGQPVAREFHCHRCRRILRIYAAIGLGLLLAVVGGLVGVTLWLV